MAELRQLGDMRKNGRGPVLDRRRDSRERYLPAVMRQQRVHARGGELREKQSSHPAGQRGGYGQRLVQKSVNGIKPLCVLRLRGRLESDEIVRQRDDREEKDNEQT